MWILCFVMFYSTGTRTTSFSWYGAGKPVWAAYPWYVPLDMFADKEKSLQLKRVSSSPRIGVWQQAAVPCDSMQGMAISPHTRNTKLQTTSSVIKILILIVKCLHNAIFSITGLIQAYLSFGTFGVSRVQEDSSIHQCAMHICHHRSYVPPTIWWTAILQKNNPIKVTGQHTRSTSPTRPFSSPNIFHLRIVLHW